MRRYFLFVLLLVVNKLIAQFNDSTHYYIKYASTGIINNTNDAKQYVLNNALAFNVNKRKVSLNSGMSWIYGEQNDKLINNDFNAGATLDILKNMQRFYYWGLANYITSYSLKINYQFQAGVGVGYNFVNKENAELVISDGILYEAGDLKQATGQDIYNTFRNSLRIKHKFLINNLIHFDGSHFWQPSLSAIDDYIIKSSSTLGVKVKKWLSITAALNYNKISRTNRENLLFTFGLTAEKYF